MSEITITSMEPGHFGVQVTEGDTTTSHRVAVPDAVDFAKEELISRGARAWLRLLDRPEVNFRFDIVEVVIGVGEPRINVIKSAFLLPEERH